MTRDRLENGIVNVRVRLAVLWSVIMFFYIYNDVFMLLDDVRRNAGTSPNPPNQMTMLAYAIVITPAALMPLLCIFVRPSVIRWGNIILGLAYFAIIVLTLAPAGTALFYRFIGIVENLVTLAVIWTAWRWPRTGEN